MSSETLANKISNRQSRWPGLVVTGLLAAGAVSLVSPDQITSLTALAHRQFAILSNPSNDSLREPYPLVTVYRQLDKNLPPDARIFFSGMIGPDKRRQLYYFYFARTYLYPREVEISLDRKPVYREDIFDGVDSTSPEEIRAHGFDVLLKIGKDGNVSALPLTGKGTIQQ